MFDMQDTKGILYLIPSFLSPGAANSLAPDFITTLTGIKHFFVENLRSARRFLKTVNQDISIDDLQFSLTDTHHPADLKCLRQWIKAGVSIGIISEAGYPCIADPGNVLVREAHILGAAVVPLVGPNAMLMALAASGFNGQNFTFSGYVPVRNPERAQAIKALEKKVLHEGATQIFMETPYRNNALLQDILTHCHDNTMLCVAVDITAPDEFIRSQSIKDWKNSIPDIHKRPAVFLLGRNGK